MNMNRQSMVSGMSRMDEEWHRVGRGRTQNGLCVPILGLFHNLFVGQCCGRILDGTDLATVACTALVVDALGGRVATSHAHESTAKFVRLGTAYGHGYDRIVQLVSASRNPIGHTLRVMVVDDGTPEQNDNQQGHGQLARIDCIHFVQKVNNQTTMIRNYGNVQFLLLERKNEDLIFSGQKAKHWNGHEISRIYPVCFSGWCKTRFVWESAQQQQPKQLRRRRRILEHEKRVPLIARASDISPDPVEGVIIAMSILMVMQANQPTTRASLRHSCIGLYTFSRCNAWSF